MPRFPATRAELGAVLWPDDDAAREQLFERMSEIEDAHDDGWAEMHERIVDYVESHKEEFTQMTSTSG